MRGRVVALDMSSQLGWAIADVEGNNSVIVESGVKTLMKAGEDTAVRLVRFLDFLNTKIGKSDRVYFEDVSMFANRNRPGATLVWSQMYGIMTYWAYTNGSLRAKINPVTLKKQFTGNHKASKEEMCATAHALGWQGGEKGTRLSHDEADAIAMIFIAEKKFRRTVSIKQQ